MFPNGTRTHGKNVVPTWGMTGPPFPGISVPVFPLAPMDTASSEENTEHFEKMKRHLLPHEYKTTCREPQYLEYSHNDGSEL